MVGGKMYSVLRTRGEGIPREAGDYLYVCWPDLPAGVPVALQLVIVFVAA